MKSHPKRFLEVTGKEIPIENKISLGYNNQDCKLPGYFRQEISGKRSTPASKPPEIHSQVSI
jgi:hypothetical protein